MSYAAPHLHRSSLLFIPVPPPLCPKVAPPRRWGGTEPTTSRPMVNDRSPLSAGGGIEPPYQAPEACGLPLTYPAPVSRTIYVRVVSRRCLFPLPCQAALCPALPRPTKPCLACPAKPGLPSHRNQSAPNRLPRFAQHRLDVPDLVAQVRVDPCRLLGLGNSPF